MRRSNVDLSGGWLCMCAALLFLSSLSMATTSVTWDGDQWPDFVMVDDVESGDNPGARCGQVWWCERDPNFPNSYREQRIFNQDFEPGTAIGLGTLSNDSRENATLLVGTISNVRWYRANSNDTPTLIATYPVAHPVTSIKFYSGHAYITTGNLAVGGGGVLYRLDPTGGSTANLTVLLISTTDGYNTCLPIDFDKDTYTEIILCSARVNDANIHGSTDLYKEDSSGVPQYIDVIMEDKNGGDDIIAGYFDGDHEHVDIFMSYGTQGDTGYAPRVAWYKATGAVNTLERVKDPIGDGAEGYFRAHRLAMGDLDHDGSMDLIVSETYEGGAKNVSWWKCTGPKSIGFVRYLEQGANSNVLVMGDWDRDGYDDLFEGAGEIVNSSSKTEIIWWTSLSPGDCEVKVDHWSNMRWATGAVLSCPIAPVGDLNYDSFVDFADFAILAANWSKPAPGAWGGPYSVSFTATAAEAGKYVQAVFWSEWDTLWIDNAVLLSSDSGSSNLLTNGSFELPVRAARESRVLPDNWERVDLGRADFYAHGPDTYNTIPPKDGNQWFVMRDCGILQTTSVQLVEGVTYTLSTFAVSELQKIGALEVLIFATDTPNDTIRQTYLTDQWFTSPSYTSRGTLIGDLNYNGAVDIADLGILVQNWLSE